MKATEAIKTIEENFTEKQIRVIKATILRGFWGDADFTLNNGETVMGYGYCTSDAKKEISDFTPRQIAGVYHGIAKTIKENKFDFMQHIPDYWGYGNASDGMLFFNCDICSEIENWARK